MRQRFEGTDFKALNKGLEDDLARVMTATVREETRNVQADWRDQVRTGGLGGRLANTVRSKVYPEGVASVDAAGWVWTKAPLIIDAFDRGATIQPTGGRFYLAIPSKNVPRKGRRPMTPVEVEAAFNQDLIIRKSAGGNFTAWVDVAIQRFTRSQGAAYGKRKQLKIGKPKLVFMFTLTRATKLRKRLDLATLGQRSDARFPAVLDRHWAGLPDRAARLRRF